MRQFQLTLSVFCSQRTQDQFRRRKHAQPQPQRQGTCQLQFEAQVQRKEGQDEGTNDQTASHMRLPVDVHRCLLFAFRRLDTGVRQPSRARPCPCARAHIAVLATLHSMQSLEKEPPVVGSLTNITKYESTRMSLTCRSFCNLSLHTRWSKLNKEFLNS